MYGTIRQKIRQAELLFYANLIGWIGSYMLNLMDYVFITGTDEKQLKTSMNTVKILTVQCILRKKAV